MAPPPERLAPEFRVRVAGRDLPPPAAADVVRVSVREDVDLPAAFTCEVLNWDQDRVAMTWSDRDTFEEGQEIEIRVGYRDALETLFVGEITALELVVSTHGPTTLSVQGFDRSHRLTRARRVRTFADMTDGDIARRVAEDAGLAAEVSAAGRRHAYLLQCNQTDLEFLRELAGRIGGEVVVRNKTLAFRPRRTEAQQAVVLSREHDLLEFRARLSTMAPASATEVRGWDAGTKRPIVGRAQAAEAAPSMGGSAKAAEAVSRAAGATTAVWVTATPATQGEADGLARAALDEASLGFVEADGECTGRAAIRAGAVIGIEGMGRRFSGPYYVTAATHSYVPSRGYRTRFEARRNAT